MPSFWLKKIITISICYILISWSVGVECRAQQNQLFDQAIQKFYEMQYTQSVKLINQFIQKFGSHGTDEGLYFLAENYILDNQLDEAKEIYQSLRTTAEDEAIKLSADYRLAEMAYHQNDYATTLSVARRLMKSSKIEFLFPNVHLIEIKALIKTNKLKEAGQRFEYIKKNYPRALLNDDIKLIYGVLKRYQGDQLAALKVFEELPERPIAHLLAGCLHLSLGRYTEAGEHFNQVLAQSKIRTHKQIASYLKAYSFYRSGNLLAANRVCQDILLSRSNNEFYEKTKLLEILIAFNQGRYQEILKLFEKESQWVAQLSHDDYSLTYLVLGDVYLNLDRNDQAIKCYQQALTHADKLKSEILIKLAYLFVKQQDWDKCHDYLKTYFQTADEPKALAYLLSVMESFARNEETSAFNALINLSGYQDGPIEIGLYTMAAYYHRLQQPKKLIQQWTILKKKRKSEEVPNFLREIAAETRVLIADAYFKTEDYPQAKQYYQKANQFFPYPSVQTEVFPGLAWCSYKLNDYAKVLLQNDKIQLLKNISPQVKQEIALITAHTYFNLKDYTKAISAYQQWLKENGSHDQAAHVYFQMGWAYYLSEAYLEAIEVWKKQVAIYPDHPVSEQSLLWIADTYFQAGENQAARSVYQQLLEKYHDSENQKKWKLRIAQTYYNDGQDKEAIYLFIEIMDSFPESEEAQIAYQGIETASYRIADALDTIPAFKDYLNKYPDSPLAEDIQYRIGAAYFKKEQYSLVSKELIDYTLKYTKSYRVPHAQYYILVSEEKMSHLDAAILQAKAFIATYPKHELSPEVTFRLASMEYEKEDYEASAEHFVFVAEQFDLVEYQARSWYNAAIAYEKINQPALALQYYDKLITTYPEDPNYEMSLTRIVALNLESHQLDKVADYLALAKKQQKNHLMPKWWFLIANYYKELGNTDKQTEYLQMITQTTTPGNETVSFALIELAALYEKQKEWNHALQAYRKLVKVSSESKWIKAAEKRIVLLEQIIKNQ